MKRSGRGLGPDAEGEDARRRESAERTRTTGSSGELHENMAGQSGDSVSGAPLPPWAERLQALVARSGLRQSEVATRAGLQRDAFGRYFRGLTRPPAKKLLAIAQVLGVAPEAIDPDRPDLAGLTPPDLTPPLYRLTPARGGDPARMFLEVHAELDRDTALAIVDLLVQPGRKAASGEGS